MTHSIHPPLADGRRHADTAQWTHKTVDGSTSSKRLVAGNAYRASYNRGAGCKRRVWTRNDPIHPCTPPLSCWAPQRRHGTVDANTRWSRKYTMIFFSWDSRTMYM